MRGMEATRSIRAMIGLLRLATCRSILLALVEISIAVNAATGAFAGVVHAHDHEHGQHQLHDHGDTLHHSHEHDVSEPAVTSFDDGSCQRSLHDTLHEHGGNVYLDLVQVHGYAPVVVASTRRLRANRGRVSELKIGLERPPRRS